MAKTNATPKKAASAKPVKKADKVVKAAPKKDAVKKEIKKVVAPVEKKAVATKPVEPKIVAKPAPVKPEPKPAVESKMASHMKKAEQEPVKAAPVKTVSTPAPKAQPVEARPVVKQVVHKQEVPAAPVKPAAPRFVKPSPILGHGVGRRKKSVARIWVTRGSGKCIVNGEDYKIYFDTDVARLHAHEPMRVIPAAASYDIQVFVLGGGPMGQAGAVRVGIARALVAADESCKSALRQQGLLTVDSRVKERKKYGQKAARRKFQFVKR